MVVLVIILQVRGQVRYKLYPVELIGAKFLLDIILVLLLKQTGHYGLGEEIVMVN